MLLSIKMTQNIILSYFALYKVVLKIFFKQIPLYGMVFNVNCIVLRCHIVFC